MMLQWTWPFAKSNEIARNLTWMCVYELQKICFPEPEVIEAPERRRILTLFKEMDSRKCGFCTPQDIAGGDEWTRDEVKNLVDAHTVRTVCGNGDMDRDTFLELMCEDDRRGHEDARRVFLKDGRSLIYQVRGVLGFRGWLLEVVPPHEEPKRRVIDALEAEVRHWKPAAEKSPEQTHDEVNRANRR